MGMATYLAVGSSLFQTYDQNKALIAKGKANQQQAQNYIMQMNYSFQNLEQERQDAFEQAISEMEDTNLQGNRLVSSVKAAVNEDLAGGGRTADLLARAAEGDKNRALSSIKSNFARKSNEIDLNKEMALINAKQNIRSIQDVEEPSLLGTMLGIATAYYEGRNTDEQKQMMREKANVDTNKVYSAPVPMYKASSYDYSGFNLRDTTTHFAFEWKNPFSAVQQNYF